MRSWRRCSAGLAACAVAALAAAGCGGGDTDPAEAARAFTTPSATPAPPPSDQLKYDLLTAAIQLRAYRLEHGTYTADETKLGEAFPRTLTVKAGDADGFYLAAYDNRRIRYVLIERDGAVQRTCKPARPGACPGGRW